MLAGRLTVLCSACLSRQNHSVPDIPPALTTPGVTVAQSAALPSMVRDTSAAAMSIGASIKAGSGASEVASVDYIAAGILSIV